MVTAWRTGERYAETRRTLGLVSRQKTVALILAQPGEGCAFFFVTTWGRLGRISGYGQVIQFANRPEALKRFDSVRGLTVGKLADKVNWPR